MKFRARVINCDFFLRIVQTVMKAGKSCVFLLTPTDVKFILSGDAADGIQVWSHIGINTVFDEYKIESQSKNEICMEVNLDNLEKALKSGIQSQNMTFKLSKKNSVPCLCFSIEVRGIRSVIITQDIPVVILSPRQKDQIVEPQFSNPSVQIMAPPLKHLRTVADRLKSISDHVVVEICMSGELILRVETEMVKISTKYTRLELPQMAPDAAVPDPERRSSARIDLRKLSKILYSYHVSPNQVICCIVENRLLILYVMLDDFYMTYYIPFVHPR